MFVCSDGPATGCTDHILIAVCGLLQHAVLVLLFSHLFHIFPNLPFDPKWWYKGGMMMVYGLEQITNVIWNISQLAKSRKSQKLKKSKFGQTLNLNEKGPKMPF